MAPSSSNNKSTAQALAEVSMQLQSLATVVEKLQETNEGTVRTRGLKERIAIAEFNIEANKQGWREMQASLQKLEESLGKNLMEVSNRFDQSLKSGLANIQTNLNQDVESIRQQVDGRLNTLTTESNTQKTAIQKMQPWFNALTWLITGAGSILLGLILTGRLTLSIAH